MDIERIKAILAGLRKSKNQSGLDSDGQPLNRNYNANRLSDRTMDELIGISKGIICDGKVVTEEAEFLIEWLYANKHLADKWPAKTLVERIEDIFADDKIDEYEKEELLEVLADITGEAGKDNLSSRLPLCKPEPIISHEGREFCFTGKFIYGSRNKCIATVKERGGFFNPNPRQSTDYLIIGIIGSTDWLHSPYGRKIENAVKLKENGNNIAIASEEHWVNFL